MFYLDSGETIKYPVRHLNLEWSCPRDKCPSLPASLRRQLCVLDMRDEPRGVFAFQRSGWVLPLLEINRILGKNLKLNGREMRYDGWFAKSSTDKSTPPVKVRPEKQVK